VKDNGHESDARSVTSGVRLRVLIPLAVAMLILIATFVLMFVFEAGKRQAEDSARTAASVENMFKAQSTEGVQVMGSIMELVMGDRRLEAALRARDRKTLFAVSEPIMKEIRAKNKITHFYYFRPDRTTLLRVHVPDNYGDRIDRFTLLEAERTGKPSWGYELGPFGTATQRVVYPWYSNGKLIGYLEMGIEFEHVIESVHKLLNVNIFVAIDKKFMNREKWEQLRNRMGKKADWNEFPEIVVPYRTEPAIPPPIAAYLADLKDSHIRRIFEATWDQHVSQTIVMPFTDQRGRILGELLVLQDICAATAEHRRAIIGIIAFCMIISGALMAIFFVLLGRVQNDMAGRTSRLTEAQRLLAVEQLERQHKEREFGLQRERIELLEAKGQMLQELIQMKKVLEERSDELQGMNEQLEQMVEERTKQLIDTQAELVRKEKLAMLGTIAAGMGNELRNPLGVINNAVYFLKTVMPDADDAVKEYLDIITTEISNSEHIINDLLHSVRTRTPKKMPATAGALIEKSLGRCTIPENIDVRIDILDALPEINVDLFQMSQVLHNLITNAVQAMPKGGVVRISARQVSNDEFQVSGSKFKVEGVAPSNLKLETLNSKPDSDFVEIRIEDTGEGIPPENMGKLFQPLFTTKARGIGLGLVLCKNLAEANGGRIEVESEPGKGTRFTVMMPVEGR